nr:type II toxin-antitoxin system antitoxin SocA domain-containing protein [Pseudanabaena sp. PCC 7367]
MTNMKVLKLLYYAQCLHLALYEEPLFPEEIQAWRYGPVCPPAYRFYSEFEAKQLPVPVKDFLSRLSSEQQDLLDEVWAYFGKHHAYQLSGMTHLEFPWKNARQGLPSEASSTEMILLEDMKKLGQKKLQEIETEHPAYMPVITNILESAFSDRAKVEVKQGEVRGWLESLLD